jgi:FkbM family methyltransferase
MSTQLATSTRRPAVGGWSMTLRRSYWRLRSAAHRRLSARSRQRQVEYLRRLAATAPRHQTGKLRLGDEVFHYNDLAALYTQYKLIFARRIYDPPRPIARGETIIEAGAHIGVSTLRFRRMSPEARIVAFEPDPEILPLLHANIRENGCEDVRVVPAALAGEAGTRAFISDAADGGALRGGESVEPTAACVATVRLSDYLTEPVALLKMNIEGAEREVLEEAAASLHRIEHLLIEYHGFPECGQQLHHILSLLDACGFRYLLHHLDEEANPAVRTPFRIDEQTRFFTLIAATRTRRKLEGGFDLNASRDQSSQAARTPADSSAASGTARPIAATPNSSEPISRSFGADRGVPIDRSYIEQFLHTHRRDIRGRVLEVAECAYTQRFGEDRVTHSDVLHVEPHPYATVVADLTCAAAIADRTYDCLILTQTLPFIFDVRAAIGECFRILKAGGILLATLPGISQVSRFDMQRWGDYWRFTPASVGRLFAEYFKPGAITTMTYGNVRSATALLYGLATHELAIDEMRASDPDYPVVIGVRAVRDT